MISPLRDSKDLSQKNFLNDTFNSKLKRKSSISGKKETKNKSFTSGEMKAITAKSFSKPTNLKTTLGKANKTKRNPTFAEELNTEWIDNLLDQFSAKKNHGQTKESYNNNNNNNISASEKGNKSRSVMFKSVEFPTGFFKIKKNCIY